MSQSRHLSSPESTYAQQNTDAVPDLTQNYAAALEQYLRGEKDDVLCYARKIGEESILQGIDKRQMIAMHHNALSGVLENLFRGPDDIEAMLASSASPVPQPDPQELTRLAKRIEQFLQQSLAPFESVPRASVTSVGESRELFEELLGSAHDLVFILDIEGSILTANHAFERAIGCSNGDAGGTVFSSLLTPSQRASAARMIAQAAANQYARPSTFELRGRNGVRLLAEIGFHPICRKGNPSAILAIARDITERKRSRDAWQRLNNALENEALRISRALHDESAQLLASVHIALATVACGLSPEQSERLQGVQQLLYKIEDQLRELSHELRPMMLDDLGLAPALDFLARGMSSRSGVPVILEDFGVGRLPHQIETLLYRVVREALTNAVRHAAASRIYVRIEHLDSRVFCVISDDGMGFDFDSVLVSNGERGFGLINMVERLKTAAGTCTISSSSNHGTDVLATVPLED